MKPTETKKVYERACAARRMKPEQGEGESWHRALRGFELRDVEQAMDAWWGSTETDGSGEMRNKWLPSTGDLKRLATIAEQARKAGMRQPKDMLRWECETCRCTRVGFWGREKTTPTDRKCPCGGKLKLLERTAA